MKNIVTMTWLIYFLTTTLRYLIKDIQPSNYDILINISLLILSIKFNDDSHNKHSI